MSIQPVAGVAGTSAVTPLSASLPSLDPAASALAGADFAGALAGAAGGPGSTGTAATTGADPAGLGRSTVGRLQDLQQLQSTADDLAVKAVTGQLADPSQYTIAASEATLATQMTVALRNKGVEAYSEIMRMQL